MSVCEYKLGIFDSKLLKPPGSKQNIQDELVWGLAYRETKEGQKNRPIKPMHSPIDIPFKLCRAKLLESLKKKSKKKTEEKDSKTETKKSDLEKGEILYFNVLKFD